MYLLFFLFWLSSPFAAECESNFNPDSLFLKAEKSDLRILLQDLRLEAYEGLLKDASKIYNPDLEHFTTAGDQFGRVNVTSETRIWFNLQTNDKRGTRARVVLKEREIEETQRELLVLAVKRELFLGLVRYKQILQQQSSFEKLEDLMLDIKKRYQRIGFLSPDQKVEVGALELALRDFSIKTAKLGNEQRLIERFFQRILNTRCEVKPSLATTAPTEWPDALEVSPKNSLHTKLDELALKKSEFEFAREEAKKVPDLKIGPVWQLNRLGSQEYNIFGLAFIMPLPFTDRNQGLREVSEVNVRRAKLEAEYNIGQRALEIDFRRDRYTEVRKHLSVAGDLSRYEILVAEYKNLFRRGLISIPAFLAFKRELTNLLFEVHALEQELANHFLQLHYLSAENSDHSFLGTLNL